MNSRAAYSLIFILFLISSCNTSSPEINTDSLLPGRFTGQAGVSQSVGHFEELNGTATYKLSASDSTFNIIMVSVDLTNDTTLVQLRMKALDLPTNTEYSFNDVDETDQIYWDNFSGFYYSALTNANDTFFSESGTITLEKMDDIGIKGSFTANVFQKAYTGKNEYTRVYSTLTSRFFAVSDQ